MEANQGGSLKPLRPYYRFSLRGKPGWQPQAKEANEFPLRGKPGWQSQNREANERYCMKQTRVHDSLKAKI